MTKVYPIILTPTDAGYVVTVPDLDINTQGKDIPEAIYMARDAIGLWGICTLDDQKEIPAPSTTEPRHESNEFVSWVDIDFDKYRLMTDMSTIRMNVTLPKYLKAMGDEARLNFSQELQDRLKERFGISHQ